VEGGRKERSASRGNTTQNELEQDGLQTEVEGRTRCKIGAWNVRAFNQAGKLKNLKKMQKYSVCARWRGNGDFTLYSFGGERAEGG
jgi:hypothetical protein